MDFYSQTLLKPVTYHVNSADVGFKDGLPNDQIKYGLIKAYNSRTVVDSLITALTDIIIELDSVAILQACSAPVTATSKDCGILALMFYNQVDIQPDKLSHDLIYQTLVAPEGGTTNKVLGDKISACILLDI